MKLIIYILLLILISPNTYSSADKTLTNNASTINLQDTTVLSDSSSVFKYAAQDEFSREIKRKERKIKELELVKENSRTLFATHFTIAICISILLIIYLLFSRSRIRKKLQEKLQEQSTELEKMSIIARQTDNAVFIMDEKADLEWVNEGFEKVYGLNFEEFKNRKGRNLLEISSNPDIKNLHKECFENKKSVTYTAEFETTEGKIWLQTTLTPILDKTGKITKLVGIESNINKLKNVEEEIISKNEELEKANRLLIASESNLKKQSDELEKLSIVARETDNAVMILDSEANFEWVNEGFVRLYGYTLEEFIKAKGGRNLRVVSSAPNINEILEECARDKKSMTYISHYSARFKKLWMQTTITPIFNQEGKLHKIVTIVSNIDKIKKAEEELMQANAELNAAYEKLKESEKSLIKQSDELEKFSIVARETDNAVMIMDSKANFEWVNEGFVRLYGYTFDEFIKAKGGTNLRTVSSSPNINDILDECIRDKKSITYISHYNVRYGKLWLQTTITPIFDSEGKLHRIVAIVSNIDKIKLAEEKIKEKNQELNIAYEKLQEVNKMKDKFFSIVAHDLKSPLAGFQQITEILSLKFNSYTEEEKLNSIHLMNNSAKLLFNLLENVLQWSRIQSGNIFFNPGKFDLKRIITENIELININAKNKSIEIVDNSVEATYVYCDRNMIDTVVRNLLSNSIKFTPKEGKVFINTKIKGDFIEVEVKDTGVGISDEDMHKLFRIDETHSTYGTSNEKGTGIGLILCKEFVEKNEGKIFVISELNKGTSFKFTLQKFF
ncbi:MAG: hypothetical protein A2W91_02345 [Bacteroidetes bacterium GWF2_38_335]|nr:MAG: hypothetical protein A2W91_02345 [Bacteroidetes bacterium GWF2_38_335]OFY80689.1 MAG: hypothetical protein A2281_05360 [Bacteroidetes bacterium RIFOXYA12_FULL_38_20]HBS87035.1 hypothetical protein [Bacteroidales bacterium]